MVLLVDHSQGQKQHKLTTCQGGKSCRFTQRRLTLTEKMQQDEPPCSSLLLGRSKLLLPRRESIGRAVVGDLLNLFTQTQLVKIVVQEQESVAFLAGSGSRLTNPVQQFAGDCLDLRMAIRFLLIEDMPDRHEQLSSHSNNRLLFANACGQPLKLGFPVRMMFDRHPGRLDHDPTQITAPLLGDTPPAIGFPRLVDTCRLRQHSPPGAWPKESG